MPKLSSLISSLKRAITWRTCEQCWIFTVAIFGMKLQFWAFVVLLFHTYDLGFLDILSMRFKEPTITLCLVLIFQGAISLSSPPK